MLRYAFTLSVVALLLLVPAFAIADDNDATKKDLAGLKGQWKVQGSQVDGKPGDPPEDEAKTLVTFNDNHIVHDDIKIPFTIDATVTPKLIDVDMKNDPNLNRKLEGIYKLDGNKLIICLFMGDGAKSRPTEFNTVEGSGRILVHLKRIKN